VEGRVRDGRELSRGLALLVVAGASACVVIRPATPRTATVASATVALDHLRDDFVAVSVRGARVTAGWLVDGPPAGAACRAGVAAVALGGDAHGLAAPDGAPLVELTFPRGALFEHLTRPSSLAVELDGTSCAVLPLAGPEPELAYRSSSERLWNAGSMYSGFGPLTGKDDVGWGVLDWDPFRLGPWLGPVRPTAAVGGMVTSRLAGFHGEALLVGYPLVFRHVAIGLGAGYELRPSWARFSDGERFKWLHGPRVELLVMAIHQPLLGFPPPVKMRKFGLAVWASRLDADRFSATILGLGLVRE
jgi:hypothetical protein